MKQMCNTNECMLKMCSVLSVGLQVYFKFRDLQGLKSRSRLNSGLHFPLNLNICLTFGEVLDIFDLDGCAHLRNTKFLTLGNFRSCV